jgi:serine/threonine-protein kinase
MKKIGLAGLATAALIFAPSGTADVPGLAPFVGSWHAHEEGLDIQANGNGHETYADRSTCPDAPMAGCGIAGTVDFTLTSVSGDTAAGAITAASNPEHPIGGPVSIKLVGEGQGLLLSVAGGDQGFPFCNSNNASHYYCGA